MIYRFSLDGEIYTLNIEEIEGRTQVEIDEEVIELQFEQIDDNLYSIIIDGRSIATGVLKRGKKMEVFIEGELYELEVLSGRDLTKRGSGISEGVYEIKAPMPCKVVKILKGMDGAVTDGEGVIVVEAMKMESELKSPMKGKVTDVKVQEGDSVESGTVLIVVSSE